MKTYTSHVLADLGKQASLQYATITFAVLGHGCSTYQIDAQCMSLSAIAYRTALDAHLFAPSSQRHSMGALHHRRQRKAPRRRRAAAVAVAVVVVVVVVVVLG